MLELIWVSQYMAQLQQKTVEPKNARILEESKWVSLKESFEVGSDDLMKEVKMMGNWLIQCLKNWRTLERTHFWATVANCRLTVTLM